MFDKENLKFISPMGDEMYHEKESLIVRFSGKRGVVSTSNLCGGYRQDLKFAFNNSCANHPLVKEKRCPGMRGKNLTEHYQELAMEIGLPINETTGMGTAARIENAASATREIHGVTVMAVATAGIDVNGGRAGDKATHDEFTKKGIEPTPGTINIFLFIDAKLDGGVLTRTIVTATEAKSAALQELMANSMYSEDLATGSGTDSVIAVCNDESEIQLYNAGKHVLLGQMIGECTKEAVTKALDLQCKMNAERQASIEWQSKRYGITKEQIRRYYIHAIGEPSSAEALSETIEAIDKEQNLLASVAAIVHICDQNRWNLIKDESLLSFAQQTINNMLERNHCEKKIDLARVRPENHHADSPLYKKILSDTTLALAYIAKTRL